MPAQSDISPAERKILEDNEKRSPWCFEEGIEVKRSVMTGNGPTNLADASDEQLDGSGRAIW